MGRWRELNFNGAAAANRDSCSARGELAVDFREQLTPLSDAALDVGRDLWLGDIGSIVCGPVTSCSKAMIVTLDPHSHFPNDWQHLQKHSKHAQAHQYAHARHLVLDKCNKTCRSKASALRCACHMCTTSCNSGVVEAPEHAHRCFEPRRLATQLTHDRPLQHKGGKFSIRLSLPLSSGQCRLAAT